MEKGVGEPTGVLTGMANIIAVAAIMLSVFPGPRAWAAVEFSPSFLGMYRKTIAVERQLFTYAAQYGIDPRLARALIMPTLYQRPERRGIFRFCLSIFSSLGYQAILKQA
jgi:hypothetical protein